MSNVILPFVFNPIFKPVFTTKCRYIHWWGGRGRGASFTTTQYFLFLLIQPNYFRGAFVRATNASIEKSLWQDLKDRISEMVNIGCMKWTDFRLNNGDMSITCLQTGNTIISQGVKVSDKSQSANLKSLAGMTHVLIEEGDEIAREEFRKLNDSVRTKKVEYIQIIINFNPPSKNSWLIKDYYNLEPSGVEGWYNAIPKDIPDFMSIHSTYRDNFENINASSIQDYRDYGNPNSPKYDADYFYRNVEGLVSEGKYGRIYKKCYSITKKQYDEYPYTEYFANDFGFSNDPWALVGVKYHNGCIYCDEKMYLTGMTDPDAIKFFKNIGITNQDEIIADSAEPKSIVTFQRAGFNMIGADKGADSILNGIKYCQSLIWFITDRSKNIWTEVEEYSWALDVNKQPTDKPIDDYNHACDAIRYLCTKRFQRGAVEMNSFAPREPNLSDHYNGGAIPPRGYVEPETNIPPNERKFNIFTPAFYGD